MYVRGELQGAKVPKMSAKSFWELIAVGAGNRKNAPRNACAILWTMFQSGY
jgi:hypothetical protein